MNTFVFFLQYSDELDRKHLSSYTTYVSAERRKRLECFAADRDRCNSLLAELLARYALMLLLAEDHAQIAFAYDEFGKPYLEGKPDISISISHTNGCVAFAVGEEDVGIDVEKLRSVNLQLADRYFDRREASRIYGENDRDAAFFEVWTKKEAYLKMLGTGLRKPLRSFCVFDDDLSAKFTTRWLEQHVLTFCSKSKDTPVIFRKVTPEQLFAAFENT